MSKYRKNNKEKPKPKAKQPNAKSKQTNNQTETKDVIRTIESLSDCELDWYAMIINTILINNTY